MSRKVIKQTFNIEYFKIWNVKINATQHNMLQAIFELTQVMGRMYVKGQLDRPSLNPSINNANKGAA
jgi:hypothetical protein